MTDSQIWLAQSAYEQLSKELIGLLRQRSDDSGGRSPDAHTRDAADQSTEQQVLAGQRERDYRIRRLQELLQKTLVGEQPLDDGVAEPGMVLTIRYEDDQEVETFLLAYSEGGAYPDELMICSPDSPLGLALPGAKQGEKRQYILPNGQAMEITLLQAVPYGSIDAPEVARVARV